MKTLLLSSLVTLLAAGSAAAQTGAGQAEADTEASVGGAAGLATGALGENFFIRAPQEYHLLASAMPGMPVFIDATASGMQPHMGLEPEAAGTMDAAIGEGEQPLGWVVDVLLDRRGGAAGLVIELDASVLGGAREVAVAMGLVRMLPDPEDPAATQILLRLDPADVDNAPAFERPDGAPAAATTVQQGQAPQGQADGQQQDPVQQPQTQQQDAAQPAQQQPEGQQQTPGQPAPGPQQPEGQQPDTGEPAQGTMQQQPGAQEAPPQGAGQQQGAPQQTAPAQQQ